MRILIRVLALLLVALTIAGPAIGPAALAEPRPLLAGPALSEPPDGAHTTGNPEDPEPDRTPYEPLGIPTFEWEDMGASRYELQIATSDSFGEEVIVVRRDRLPYPMYTPTGFDEIGAGLGLTEDLTSGAFIDAATFYWRARAYDDAYKQWGDWSATRSFVRHWGYKPTNLREGPAEYQAGTDDDSVMTLTPYLEWDPVPGASFYQIQVDTSNSFGSPYINATTDVPRYTPTSTLQNDDDLFWRVRAFHRPNASSLTGGRGGVWSEVRQFKLAWSSQTLAGDRRPLLLTPPNGANYVYRPLFCWQPVEGAKKYRIDVDDDNYFTTPPSWMVNGAYASGQTEGTCYSFPRDGTFTLEYGRSYWWRVTAMDGKNYLGQATDEGITSAPFEFHTADSEMPVVPDLIYPPYYYPPIRVDDPEYRTFEDRTVSVPTFIWGRVDGASFYELCIDDVPYMDCTSDSAIVVQTENASYTFTDTDLFQPVPGQDYYWKVRANNGPTFDDINTAWLTRIDRSLLTATAETPEPLLPTYGAQPWTANLPYGEESATYYPVFAWRPVAENGAARYQVQVAIDADFAQVVHVGETMHSEYTPLDRPEPGTYFWRVRQVEPATSDWTAPGRFIVSRAYTYGTPDMAGSRDDWAAEGLGWYEPANEAGDSPAGHDLVGAHVVMSRTDTLLGLPVGADTTLGIYLDTDHIDTRGAGAPPSQRWGPTVPESHFPEYAIYWKYEDDTMGAGEVWEWLGTSWQKRGTLANILSEYSYDVASQFLKLRISSSQIDQPGSLSLLFFTVDSAGEVVDLLPNRLGEEGIAAFHTEGMTPTPILPVNSLASGEDLDYWSLTQIERNTPVLRWRHTNALYDDGVASALFFQTYKDDTFTALYENENGKSPSFASSASLRRFWDANTHWAPQVHYSDNNSYNWRISRSGFGPSAPHRFTKLGYIPTKLDVLPVHPRGDITGTHVTPSFTWQAAQSAPSYLWELFEGGTRRAYQETMVPYFTPRGALKDGSYTWKVWAKDARGRLTSLAAQEEFRKETLRVEENDVREDVQNGRLVLGWKPIPGAAYYKLTIASDINLSRNVNTYSVHGTTFTPDTLPKAVQSGGGIYWRVVVCDNKNNVGQYLMDPRFLPDPPDPPPAAVLNLPVVLRH